MPTAQWVVGAWARCYRRHVVVVLHGMTVRSTPGSPAKFPFFFWALASGHARPVSEYPTTHAAATTPPPRLVGGCRGSCFYGAIAYLFAIGEG
jgi:hypothetical protein